MVSFQRALLYFHTIRHLRPSQIGWRLWYRLYRPQIPSRQAPPVRKAQGAWTPPVPREASLLDPQTAFFLNQRGRIDDPDIWNDARYDKLWLYHLNYFDDLNARGADERNAWHRELIERWIQENPPGHGNGWEPYPTSLRIVNWVKWLQAGNTPTEHMLNSLATQTRLLRRRLEYHILGNHLLANAKALCFAGLFFSGREADRWYRTGRSLLKRELAEQILPDGGHFERSPMYHLTVLEDVLDVMNVLRTYGEPVPAMVNEVAGRMLIWAAVMRHPDGEIPFFNDAAFGMAPSFDAVQAYAQRAGHSAEPCGDVGVVRVAASGYVRLDNGAARAFMDVAPVGPDYLPGHAHADTLSIELSVYGQRVIVNTGTSVYGADAERLRQRGTAAHSTVMVDSADSSEVWSGFRVARRAYPRDVQVATEHQEVSAWHDGYRRFPGHPWHRRTVRLDAGALSVVDEVGAERNQHDVIGRFHLHPDVTPSAPICALGNQEEWSVRLGLPEAGRELQLSVRGAQTVALEPSTYHPRFGVSLDTYCVTYRHQGNEFPLTVTTTVAVP